MKVNELRIPKTDYSRVAEYYDKVRTVPSRILFSKIMEYAQFEANCTVLDVGCGTGRFSLQLSTVREALFCALEPSIEMLREAVAKDKTKSLFWIQGDGQRLPFRSKVFNCVYMTMVLHHLENRNMAIREIYRVLKQEGKCVIMTTSHSRIRKHVLNDFPGVTAIDLDRFPTVPSIEKTMKRIGFGDVHYHPIQLSEDVSTDEYLERVRNKYVSTLTLLSEEAFQQGFRIFAQRLRRRYGAGFKRVSGFVFVVGRK